MKFDRSNVKTILDMDSVDVGQKGYFANSLLDLKDFVENEDQDYYGQILQIEPDGVSDCCFHSDLTARRMGEDWYIYFYPVSERIPNEISEIYNMNGHFCSIINILMKDSIVDVDYQSSSETITLTVKDWGSGNVRFCESINVLNRSVRDIVLKFVEKILFPLINKYVR